MKNLILYIISIFLLFFIISLLLKNKSENKNDIEENEYIVNFSPCGDVKFKKIPTKILTSQQTYNDILIAFKKQNNIIAVSSIDKFYIDFYNSINLNRSLNNDLIQFSMGRNLFDKELFYSINADVHHIDPITLAMTKGWSKNDVDEISTNIGPFFGNRYSIENKKPSYIKNYKFYTLDEITLKFGEVYKKEETAIKLNKFANELAERISHKLKNVEGKTIAIIYLTKKGIVPFDSTSNGYGLAQYKILKCKDAFKEKGIKTYSYEGNFGTIVDKEILLLANPDVIIVNEGIYIDKKYNFFSRRTSILLNELETYKNDPLLKDVPALKNNKIILGGIYDQGPIVRIFQLEMMAKQIYPEIFGKFRLDHKYQENEELFSRIELMEILNE